MLDVDDLIRRHRQTGILVDAQLLLVFLMAQWNRTLALKFKRTRDYDEKDHELLFLILGPFNRFIVTPSVLAEVSNLAGHLSGDNREEFFAHLAALIASPLFEQRCVSLTSAVGAACFIRLGFTDGTVEQLGLAGAPVLTDDEPLYLHLQHRGVESIYLGHLRAALAD